MLPLENLPTGQRVQELASTVAENFPGRQLLQAGAISRLKKPASHEVQVLLAVGENFPSTHVVQESEPDPENLPLSHCWQEDDPSVGAKVPALQLKQFETPAPPLCWMIAEDLFPLAQL